MNNRLYYKYSKYKDKIINKKIPYIIELPFIFYRCHVINNIHFGLRKSQECLEKQDYYYEGVTKDLSNYIKQYSICNINNNLKKAKIPLYPIIEEGPKFRIEMDLWYLDDDIARISKYNYVLDILDHFSKWVFSYPLITKNANEILICLRKYILSFGIVKKL